MPEEIDDTRGCGSVEPSVHEVASARLERVQELTSAMLEDVISDAEFAELERLLLEDESARASYLHSVQLHADLAAHFAPPAEQRPATTTTIPILSSLGDGLTITGSAAVSQPAS